MLLLNKKVIFSIILLLLSNEPAIAGTISAEEIFNKLGFSSAEKEKIANGEFVSKELSATHDRELAITIAFHVKMTIDELRNEIKKKPIITTDPGTIDWSSISRDASLADFKMLDLGPDERERSMAYLKAEPGIALNLSKDEILAFNAIEVLPGQSPIKPTTEAVKKQLLERLRAYRQNGLSGIAPYERAKDNTSVSTFLRQASETLSTLKTIMPGLYNVLIDYPKNIPDELSEEFIWHNYNAYGEPVFILLHQLEMADAEIFVVVQRQFYVSGSYNGGQSISAFVPVENGKATIVFYVNRVSTDQISGLASTLKRSMGSKIMINKLKDIFQQSREKVEQNIQQ